MIQWIVFAIVSLLLIVISGQSLRNPRSHGFYRFFAWEAILGLIVLNAPVWFRNPLSWNQVVSWVLLFTSLIPLVLGVHMLHTRGKPAKQRQGDSALLGFEKTTTLVTSGIYKYLRHPLYSSLFLLAWGTFFKAVSSLGMVLAMTATLFLIATAKADEAECTLFFGLPYQEYRKKTKMFIPYIF